MIVTMQKPLNEIYDYISGYDNMLLAGCDGCTQPPRGIKEAEMLGQMLELLGRSKNKPFVFKTLTIAKQCDMYLDKTLLDSQLDGADAVLSLACGIGVQELVRLYPTLPIFPVQNTHFYGAEEREQGIIEERCAGCGDCIIALTGGICPVARCTKHLLNGACGGSRDGKCELTMERDCVWVLIYEQMKKLGKLHLLKEFRPAKNNQLTGWRTYT
jgi:hypothetical protein